MANEAAGKRTRHEDAAVSRPALTPRSAQPARPAWLRYGCPLVLTSLVVLLKLILGRGIGEEAPFLLFFAPIVASAWYGGTGPALLALGLSALSIDYYFLVPYQSFGITSRKLGQTALFLIEGGFVIGLTLRFERATRRMHQQARELAAQRLALSQGEERFRLLVEGVRDYAIFMLDLEGRVASWNAGAERIKGYTSAEILGQPFSIFYTEGDHRDGHPQQALADAAQAGRHEEQGWRVRKDGTRFFADTVITALRDDAGQLRGYAKITRDVTERRRTEEALRRLAQELEQRVAERTAELASANRELEAFAYSVSHDLRAPLRAIDGFSKALLNHYRDRLDDQGRHYLERVRAGTQRMATLIDDLLKLSRITRTPMRREPVDLSQLARTVLADLRRRDPERDVEVTIADGLMVQGDSHFLQIALENLLSNAWKFTAKKPHARIEVGGHPVDGRLVFFVRDDGAGFDMTYSDKLFAPFQRLHAPSDFEGTGIGLAIVHRIIARHGGRIWAEAAEDRGAIFSFTLGASP